MVHEIPHFGVDLSLLGVKMAKFSKSHHPQALQALGGQQTWWLLVILVDLGCPIAVWRLSLP